eukprot:5814119-Prymnesium_polylepis.1
MFCCIGFLPERLPFARFPGAQHAHSDLLSSGRVARGPGTGARHSRQTVNRALTQPPTGCFVQVF